MAASHAPVPEAGNITTAPEVWNMPCIPSRTSAVNRANSGPRWSITGRSIARSTRSGTLVGPGIWRKCRPVRITSQSQQPEEDPADQAADDRHRESPREQLVEERPVVAAEGSRGEAQG